MRREQQYINRIADALETLMQALTTYDLSPEELERLDALADDLKTFADGVEAKDAAALA